MLLIYTDGISECRAPDGRFLGPEGLFPAFRDLPCNAGELIDRIKRIICDHQRDLSPADDQTAVAIAMPIFKKN